MRKRKGVSDKHHATGCCRLLDDLRKGSGLSTRIAGQLLCVLNEEPSIVYRMRILSIDLDDRLALSLVLAFASASPLARIAAASASPTIDISFALASASAATTNEIAFAFA